MGRQIVEKPRGLGSGASAMVHLRLRRETAKVDHGLFLARVSCTPAHHQQAHPHRPKIRDGEKNESPEKGESGPHGATAGQGGEGSARAVLPYKAMCWWRNGKTAGAHHRPLPSALPR